MKSLIRSVLGVAVVLAWWTLTGDGGNTETADAIPAQVWEGGAGTLDLEIDTSTASQMRVSFSEDAGEFEEGRSLATHQDVPAGHHAWSIDVPAGVGGYVELGAVAPQPGDRLSWTIRVNGSTVDQQSETLERPLESGWAFAIQSYFDDYASGTLGDG